MNYELAKKLKDAGFPQLQRKGDRYAVSIEKAPEYEGKPEFEFIEDVNPPEKADDWFFFPNLLDIIEVCGSKFASLMIGPDLMWCAKGNGVEIFGQGTPEEAVANLWLALNKHESSK